MTNESHASSAEQPTSLDALFPGDSELAALMRATAWSRTALGSPQIWPQSLRTIVRMLLTSRYQMWMGWGPQLHFFYNDAYRPTLGAKHPDALGRPTRELWAEIWGDIGPRIQHVLDTGEATWDDGLLLLLERNGYPEETYHTFSYSPLFDDAGAIGGMLSVVMEETERVISERRLALIRELSSHLATAKTVDAVMSAIERACPVAARDLPFTLTYLFDDAMRTATLAARTGDWIDGSAATAAVLDLTLPAMWPIAEALRTGGGVVFEPLPTGVEWPRGPWAVRPRSAIVTPIPEQGQSGAAGVFIAGVNPHRPCDHAYRGFFELLVGQIAAGLANARAYESEKRRAEALAEIDRAKTVFFSNVSHEFRTPLTLMLGPLDDLAARADVADDVRAQVGMIRRNGARLLRLVNTLLDFSRIEAGRAQARYEPTDLAEYTRELASTFQSAVERAGLDLQVDCAPVGEAVYVDRSMWEKIVLNLLSNAFKYTLQGRIAVSLERVDGDVALQVTDTGVGIPAEELPRLFDRFHRVEGARGRSHEGSGIGLALVHELVKLHGGSVAAASTPGLGSTFTVRLPLGRSHLPAKHVSDVPAIATTVGASLFVEEALQWLPHSGAETAHGAGEPAAPRAAVELERIVVADDSADMRDYITRLLSARWRVETVGNGRDALAAIQRERPHLVITDIMMPDLDGFGLLRALRDDLQTQHLPVLVLSARAGDEARIEGLEAGASDYLVKPFSARELVARVEALLLRARVRDVEEAHARRLTSIFAQAPVAIAILRGPDHVFEMTNASYMQIVEGRDVLGKPLREALPEVAAQGFVAVLDEVVRSKQPYTARSRSIKLARRSDGVLEEHFFDFVFQPLVDDSGEVGGVAAVGHDVTELSKARQDAEVANRAKDEFLAMLGHELRNPLAPILTALQLLRLRGVEAGERERQVIERQVQHLVSLVDDLLDVSRITRGKIHINARPIDLSEVVAKAIETASPLLEQKGHDLQIDVPRRGLVVDGDADRLAQVVANLLTNAAKYTENGGRISVHAAAVAGEVVLRVRDTGIGIAPEMLPRVFDLFVQERQALDRAQGGLGLGLAIVRSLVNLHGGRVGAHSDGPGHGSEFVVALPRSTAQMVAAEEEVALTHRTPQTVQRILVVDDNLDAATMLADALTAQGHVARVASNGVDALQLAAEFHPDIALLDVGLPVMDGYELARRLSEDPELRGLKMIAVTGYGQEQDRRRSAEAGFNAHLVKPVDLDQLRAVVEGPIDGAPTR